MAAAQVATINSVFVSDATVYLISLEVQVRREVHLPLHLAVRTQASLIADGDSQRKIISSILIMDYEVGVPLTIQRHRGIKVT